MQYGILRHQNRLFVIPNGLSTLGRHPDCNFVLDHPSVSRQHALILSQGGSYTVLDYKSANGVLVNGKSIFRRELRPGDVLRLGEMDCEFTIETDLEGRWRDVLENFEAGFVTTPYLHVLERGARAGIVQDRPRFQFLLDATRELASVRSPREVGIRALHAALTGLLGSRGFVAQQGDRGRIEILTSIGIAPERIERIPFYLAVVEKAWNTKALLRSSESFPDFVHHEPRIVLEDIGSIMAVPLPGGSSMRAALYIDRMMSEAPFTPGDEPPMAVLAEGVGLALEASLWRAEIEETLGAVEFLGQGSGTFAIQCGVCGEPAIGGTREGVVCDTCNALHHRDCWVYNGGCSRYGCGGQKHQSLAFVPPLAARG